MAGIESRVYVWQHLAHCILGTGHDTRIEKVWDYYMNKIVLSIDMYA